MPTIDYNAKEVLLRFGVAGAPGAGKTQALWRLHAGLPPELRAELVMRAVGEDQIVSFDFTPPDLVPISEFQLVTETIRRFRMGYVAAFGAPERALAEGRYHLLQLLEREHLLSNQQLSNTAHSPVSPEKTWV